jgi:hypothetical protein
VRTAAAAVLAAVLGVIAGQGLQPTPALGAGAEMPRVVLTAFDSLHVLAHELVPDSIEGPLARTHAFLTPFPER